MEIFRKGNSQIESVLNGVFGCLAILILIAAIIMLFTGTWPVNVINNFQSEIFDGYYYPQLTFFAVILPMLGIGLGFKAIVIQILKMSGVMPQVKIQNEKPVQLS